PAQQVAPSMRSAAAEAFAELRGATTTPSQVSESRPGAPTSLPAAGTVDRSSPAANRAETVAPMRPEPMPAPQPLGNGIQIHERADVEIHQAVVAPKNVAGFKLPPSTLLNAGGGPQAIREDELR